MFPHENLPDIHAFCRARLETARHEADAEAPGLLGRLEVAVHTLRALGPETWPQAEQDIREIAARFAAHAEYAALELDADE